MGEPGESLGEVMWELGKSLAEDFYYPPSRPDNVSSRTNDLVGVLYIRHCRMVPSHLRHLGSTILETDLMDLRAINEIATGETDAV